MSAGNTLALEQAYRAACRLDVESFKPGNVSLASAGHGMTAAQFLRSADCSSRPLTDARLTLGERILAAIDATHDAVGCNTNLGIVLLIAPLVQACLDAPGETLPAAVRRVLAATTVGDADAVYRAIRVASPGGLGRAHEQDVQDAPVGSLVEVMALAADRDLIARQYANGFAELLDVALPYYAMALSRHASEELAMTDLYLFLLARYPDSHVVRKHGQAEAQAVVEQAGRIRDEFQNAANASDRDALLRDFDRSLKARAINPGTTADLCVAASFSHRQHGLAVTHTGSDPDHPRDRRPEQVEEPHRSKSQTIEGESKWQ